MIKDNPVLSSIAKFVIDAGNEMEQLNVYYHVMPEKTRIPLIYFPNPVFQNTSETMSSYGRQMMWYPKVIAMSSEDAYRIASNVMSCISGNRNQIPLLNIDGSKNGHSLSLDKNCQITQIDDNTYQIALSWIERFLFDDVVSKKNSTFNISISKK